MPIRSRQNRAPIHINDDRTLMVIPNLVETNFGIQRPRSRSKWIGTCLIAQVSFTISSITGLKPMVLSKHILRQLGHEGDANGFTLEEILEAFETPVLTRQGLVWLTLGVTVYKNVKCMIAAVLNGFPVITIIPREVCDVLENEAMAYGDGQTFSVAIRPAREDQYHSYLAIGFEVKNNLSPAEFVIVRDSRNEYCFKGYMKIGSQTLTAGWEHIRALSVDVLNVER